jgi:hypothetical protein
MKDDIIFYGALNNKNKSVQGYAYSVYGVDGICATITTGCGGGAYTSHFRGKHGRSKKNW